MFSWRDLWPALAETLGAEIGPDEPLSLAQYLPARAAVWDTVVRERGLRAVALADVLGESHHYADLCFAYGAEQSPPPTYLSTVKIKQAGFCGTWNTEQSFCHWLRFLVDAGVLLGN